MEDTKPKKINGFIKFQYYTMSLFCALIFVFILFMTIASFFNDKIDVYWVGTIIGLAFTGFGAPGCYQKAKGVEKKCYFFKKVRD